MATAGGKTVVIKLGTSSILSESTMQHKIRIMSSMVEAVMNLRKAGHRVILVCSGAIGAGRVRMGLLEPPKDLGQRQALAALGQLRLMSLWDSLFSVVGINVAQVLVTRTDLADSNRYHNARTTLETLMSTAIDAVPIVNENDTVSVHEMRFGDNDSLSAITAGLVDADFLFLCTDVDGLYTDNPRSCPTARRLNYVRSIDEARQKASVSTMGTSFGTGGMQTKLIAAELATAAGVATVIINGEHPENIARIVDKGVPNADTDLPEENDPSDSPPHTMFLPSQSRLPARKWRILHAMHPVGSLIIDQGAYQRISKRDSGGRLLPAGVVGVQGTWERLQAVKLFVRQKDENGQSSKDVEVGRALANYTSVECERIKGLQSTQIFEVLGTAESCYITDQIVLSSTI
ncbi:glutamate 5-kinase [Malassezia psittaci]|uniref:Glutamate 5-kinase n=1 Tax=Malassezia psittaci TaxID=1821823 RepID=A0AAF0JD28_9BASI|nr:glutamate 5-kinase [Malassezia psittaci]